MRSLLRLVPAPVYARLKRSRRLRPMLARLADVAFRSNEFSATEVVAGPLKGFVLELQPRTNKDMIVGRYESELVAALSPLLATAQTMFDVGAHLGYMSLVAARLMGADGKVVAFEADEQIVRRLRANVARNAASLSSGVNVVHAAVGDRSGRARFTPGDTTGTGHLSAGGTTEVAVVSLDDGSREYGVPDLVKIDVEGAELQALAGARALLSGGKTSFLVEAHSPELERKCLQLLHEHRYETATITRSVDTSHLLARPARPA